MTKQFTLAHQVRAKFSRVTKLAGAALLAASLFAATAQAAQVPEGVKLAADQTLKYALTSDPTTFDPSVSGDGTSKNAQRPVFEPLVKLAPGGREFVGLGAESWETSADGLTWTMHLRKNAKWSDGKPVTAADYVYSFRRFVDPKTLNKNADEFKSTHVKNVDAVLTGKANPDQLGVKAVDDYTLVFELDTPNDIFLSYFQGPETAPLRQDLVEKYPDSWTSPEHLVGNGPFVVKEYKRGDYILYDRNPNYWDKDNLTLEHIRVRFILNSVSEYQAYLANELHYSALPSEQRNELKEKRKDEFHNGTRYAISYFGLNVARVPKPVRNALQLLVDQNWFVNKLLNQGVATSVYAHLQSLGNEKVKQADWLSWPYNQRKEAAVKLLTEAGYTKDNPAKVSFLSANSAIERRIYNAFAGFADTNTGGLIKVTYDPVESKVFFDRWERKDYDVRASGSSTNFNYAGNYLESFQCKHSQNTLNYCNPEFDEAYAKLHNASAEEKQDLFLKMSNLLLDDAPVLPMWNPEWQVLVSPALGGFRDDQPNGRQDFRDLYIVDGKKVNP